LCYLFKGDLILDPPMEKFVSLMDRLFDHLPYLLSESAGQIAGSDPTSWPQYEELVEPSRSPPTFFHISLYIVF